MTHWNCLYHERSHTFLVETIHKLSYNKDYKRMAREVLGETPVMEYIAVLFVDI